MVGGHTGGRRHGVTRVERPRKDTLEMAEERRLLREEKAPKKKKRKKKIKTKMGVKINKEDCKDREAAARELKEHSRAFEGSQQGGWLQVVEDWLRRELKLGTGKRLPMEPLSEQQLDRFDAMMKDHHVEFRGKPSPEVLAKFKAYNAVKKKLLAAFRAENAIDAKRLSDKRLMKFLEKASKERRKLK